MEVFQLKDASPETLRQLQALLAQLRTDAGGPIGSLDELRDAVGNDYVAIVVAKEGETIVGMAVLNTAVNVGRHVGYVEDVVVDESRRGHGLGEALMRKVIEIAREKQITKLRLTSRPSRTAAHKLYQRLGFEQQDTNVYRLKL